MFKIIIFKKVLSNKQIFNSYFINKIKILNINKVYKKITYLYNFIIIRTKTLL